MELQKIKLTLKTLLKMVGLYKPLRFVYNFIFLFNAKTELIFSDLTAKFRTPTFKIKEDIESLLGESEVLKTLLDKLQPADTVWDIGASYGIYTIFFSLKVNKGNVFAFEPEKATYKLLTKNIQLNNLKNVTPLQMALGDIEGITELHISESANIGTHSLAVRTDYPISRKGQKIQIQKGSDLVKQNAILSPTAIKIDVEGAELNVLRGIETILSSPVLRLVQIEIHPKLLPLFGGTLENIFMLMELNGFAAIKSIQRGTELEVLFKKPMLAKS